MTSQYQKVRDQQIKECSDALITQMTGFVPGQHNFEIAQKFILSNFKFHTFPDTDKHHVERKFRGILEKIQIFCKPQLADYLEGLFEQFHQRRIKEAEPDIHYRVLDLLICLSGNIINYNQNRDIPNKKQKNQNAPKDPQDLVEIDKILQEWGDFEQSSEEEEIDREVEMPQPEQKAAEQPVEILEEEKSGFLQPNFLSNFLWLIVNCKIKYLIKNNKRRRSEYQQNSTQPLYEDLLNSNLNASMYSSRVQNYTADIVQRAQSRLISSSLPITQNNILSSLLRKRRIKEVELVQDFLYAFQQKESQLIYLVKIEEEIQNISLSSQSLLSTKTKSFQFNVQNELRKLSQGYFSIAQDIEIQHLSIISLKQGLQQLIDLVNLIHCIKSKTDHALTQIRVTKHLFEVENQVQEAFWVCIQKEIERFHHLIIQLMQQLVYHTMRFDAKRIKCDAKEFDQSLTLIKLARCLQDWPQMFAIILDIALQMNAFQGYVQESIFSSPTLTLLSQLCQTFSLQPGRHNEFIIRTFFYCFDPYCSMLNSYLDYNNVANIKNFEIRKYIPKFLQSCIAELQNIGNAFQIFSQLNENLQEDLQLKKVNFREALLSSILEQFQIPQQKVIKRSNPIDYIKLGADLKESDNAKIEEEIDPGPYDIYTKMKFNSFAFKKLFNLSHVEIVKEEPVKYFSQLTEFIQDQQLPYVFSKKLHQLVKEHDKLIQERLLKIVYEKLDFLSILKFIRIVYFLDRADIMQVLVEKAAEGSNGVGRIKGLEALIKENMKENNVKPSWMINKFSLHVDMNPQVMQQVALLDPKHFYIRVQFSHPIDLIIDEKAMLLYNKILQYLLFFKNAKLNVSNIQQMILLKRMSQIEQNRRKMKRKELQDENESDNDDLSGKNNSKMCYGLLRKFLMFAQEVMNFLKNYEYFLFQSVIANQSEIFEEHLKEKTSLNQIISLHMTYLTIIADKMFLNQKTEQILDSISQILHISQNLPLIVTRILSIDMLDSQTIKIESLRTEKELQKMKDSFLKQLSALIILFDKSDRKSYAPEMIEAISKTNFNSYYTKNQDA